MAEGLLALLAAWFQFLVKAWLTFSLCGWSTVYAVQATILPLMQCYFTDRISSTTEHFHHDRAHWTKNKFNRKFIFFILMLEKRERILWLYELWSFRVRVQLTLKWACIEILNYKVAPNVLNMAEFSPARKGPAQQLFQISLNISNCVMSQRQ